MRTNTTVNKAKTLSTITLLVLALAATPSFAGSKTKPPTGEQVVEMSWYQPVLDFFNI